MLRAVRMPLSPDRRSRFKPLAALGVPEGAPPRLYRLARLRRVAAVLGPALERHLISVEEHESTVTLRFAGSGWDRALAEDRDELAPRIARALGRVGCELLFASAPGAQAARRDGRRGEFAGPSPPTDSSERLRRIAERLLVRMREARDSGA